jgi:hypothetical protein
VTRQLPTFLRPVAEFNERDASRIARFQNTTSGSKSRGQAPSKSPITDMPLAIEDSVRLPNPSMRAAGFVSPLDL